MSKQPGEKVDEKNPLAGELGLIWRWLRTFGSYLE